jgi:ATP synthase protein I
VALILEADIVRRVMAGNQPSKPPNPSGANDGWTVVGYLLSGIIVWGGIGWLIDRWLHLSGIPIAIGTILGAGLATYIVLKRFGST